MVQQAQLVRISPAFSFSALRLAPQTVQARQTTMFLASNGGDDGDHGEMIDGAYRLHGETGRSAATFRSHARCCAY